MGTLRSEPNEETRLPATGGPSRQGQETPEDAQSLLTDLFREHREALRRIILLETQFNGFHEQLTAGLHDATNSSAEARPDRLNNSTDLLARIQALEAVSLRARVEALENRPPEPDRHEQDRGTGEKPAVALQHPNPHMSREPEIAHLRSLVATLTAQLTEAKNATTASDRPVPSRRRRRRWWRKIWKGNWPPWRPTSESR